MKGKRLPDVKTLYDILPKGVESGKEFARIVDLLLFHEARRAGKTITIFNDAAGDYHGLDSFESGTLRKRGTTGYQYKFYQSPLSADHRQNIEGSLARTAKTTRRSKIGKWILITPQDLVESATRNDGGDVTWFRSLKTKFKLKFDLDHWGHTKLLSLFLETPALCLFYYPELVSDGATRKLTIQDTRKRYDDNLIALYRNIEFVGMSVYKPEATKGVPMEHIYIPLNVTPDSATSLDNNISRVNPLVLRVPGAKSVVLGDPGSGKSTLQRFLSLSGISEPLQKRYAAAPDTRLPVFVTLRRYADELKSRKNLSLLDYIKETVQGDFSLTSADHDFFAYYLESGQTILLFDGLDELPNPDFKQIVRDRIRSLITSYPGNTTIVTSRIVGYDNPFRFDDKEFSHYKLTKLQLPEIEQFVADWYRVRIENDLERTANIKDLVRILRDDSHTAIRELAENPLLLTIIALVHRIDAVLPDERVVLYQKCTETLLNTWHTWKFREAETRNRGKVERRNRRRMEAIAGWMHSRSVGTSKSERAVAPYKELHAFLSKHIADIEQISDPDSDAEDLANEFLEFVRKRAGLLIEAGDNQYSFVHQTFQEYLTSSHIITTNEVSGVKGIWDTIGEECGNPRWQEVIRLLVASLKADDTQRIVIDKILSKDGLGDAVGISQLLGGFLLDGIEPAEAYREEIMKRLLRAASSVDDVEQVKAITSLLRACISKDGGNVDSETHTFESLWKSTRNAKERMALVLAGLICGFNETKIIELTENFLVDDGREANLYRMFVGKLPMADNYETLKNEIELLWAIQSNLAVENPAGNFLAAAVQSVTFVSESTSAAKAAFELQLQIVFSGAHSGPFSDFNANSLLIAAEDGFDLEKLAKIRNGRVARLRDDALQRGVELLRSRIGKSIRNGDQPLEVAFDLIRARTRSRFRTRNLAHNRVFNRIKKSLGTAFPSRTLRRSHLIKDLPEELFSPEVLNTGFWQTALTQPAAYNAILEALCATFFLEPKAQWWEALRLKFLPTVPGRMKLYRRKTWEDLATAFEAGGIDDEKIYLAASCILLDCWMYVFEYHDSSEGALGRLVFATKNVDAPSLNIAHCIRDLAYGNEGRIDDLISMVFSRDEEYRSIFTRSCWLPTKDEETREMKQRRASPAVRKSRKKSKQN